MAEEYKDQAVNVQEEGVGEVKDRGFFDHFKGKVQEAREDEQQQHQEHHAANVPELGVDEVKDRGLFDHFKGKKESAEEKQKHQEDPQEVLVTGVGKIHIDEGQKEEEMEEEKKHGFLDKLHRSGSSSSSSSSEEDESKSGVGNKEKTRRKKKSLKDKVHEKFHGVEKKEEEWEEPAFAPPVAAPPATEDSSVHVEKVDVHGTPAATDEEKKGFLDKIKEKLPGHGKKTAEESGFLSPAPSPAAPAAVTVGAAVEHGKEQEVEGHEGKEKKGFLGKIIEKLPGYHKNTGEEGEKGPASH